MMLRCLRPLSGGLLVLALVTAAADRTVAAELIVNGGFESGLSGWTVANVPGGDGSFVVQSGLSSPANGDPVPAPPGGTFAAMSDGLGPGSHVLYQDIFIPVGVTLAQLRFDLFLGNRAGDFFTPASGSLDFSIADFNQQARVDILRSGADPFSVASTDVLQNLYQTQPGDPAVSGYSTIVADLGSLLSAHGGETLRLRFAETDNVFSFQMGVDNVSLNAVPEPSSLLLAALGGMACALGLRYRRAFPVV